MDKNLTDEEKVELAEARAGMRKLAENYFERGDQLKLNQEQRVGLLAMMLEEIYKRGAHGALDLLKEDFERHKAEHEANQGKGIAGPGFVMGGNKKLVLN